MSFCCLIGMGPEGIRRGLPQGGRAELRGGAQGSTGTGSLPARSPAGGRETGFLSPRFGSFLRASSGCNVRPQRDLRPLSPVSIANAAEGIGGRGSWGGGRAMGRATWWGFFSSTFFYNIGPDRLWLCISIPGHARVGFPRGCFPCGTHIRRLPANDRCLQSLALSLSPPSLWPLAL